MISLVSRRRPIRLVLRRLRRAGTRASARAEVDLSLHGLQGFGKVRLDAVTLEVGARLLDALDLPDDGPVLSFLKPAPDDVDHGRVEHRVEVATSISVGSVGVVQTAVRV